MFVGETVAVETGDDMVASLWVWVGDVVAWTRAARQVQAVWLSWDDGMVEAALEL
jgi:hypothetical protein